MRLDMTLPHLNGKAESTLEFTKVVADDVYVMPTSLAQQRYWILDQLEPGNTSLNMPLALRLTGRLDTAALQQTLNEIVSRHEVLRTTLSKNNGKPVQVIAAKQILPLEVIDLSDRLDKENESNRLMVEEAHHKFNLLRGPLFKTKLIRLETEDHILLLTLHHIICDGWSNGVLVREIGEIYDAFSQGLPSPLYELPIQYADFAAWQQDWLSSDGFEDQLAYWKQHLGKELRPLEIPTDFPRNKNRGSFGALESLLLSRPLTRAIKTLGQREDVTPFMIFLSAFKVLLHRYSGQDEIIIGSPTANRLQSETEGLIGAFANTLLLKSDISGEPTFKELLHRIKNVSLGAFSNQTLPFEKLIETIRPAANGRKGGQLFQVLFIFQTAFMQPVELNKLSIKPMRSVSPGSIFELSLGVVERSEGTRLQLEYNTDLFTAGTVKIMLDDLRSILQSAVLDTDRKLSDLLEWTTPLRSQVTKGSDNLPASIPAQTSAAVPGVVNHKRIEETLIKIWQDVLHIDSISVNDDFFEIGGHSLLAAQLFDEIAKQLKVNLPLATLFTATTIEQLAELIRKEQPENIWNSLVPINAGGTKPPLFLMHAAGGDVLFYKDLARHLGDDQPLYALQSQGFNDESRIEKTVEGIAARYVEEIRTVQPNGPYLLGGMCFGAYLALEAAQQLRSQGQEVDQLIVFDSAPPRTNGYSPKSQGKSFGYYVRKSWHRLLSPEFYRTFLKWCAERKFVRRISDRMRLSKIRKTLGPRGHRNRALERAYLIAARDYVASPYDGRVILIRSEEFSSLKRKNGHLLWGELAHGGFKQFVVRGRHLELLREPTVEVVAERLRDYLNGAIPNKG